MILTAHQPVYLPWLGLFHKIMLADMFCVFDIVQYQRRDYNNRNKIMTNSGPIWLTVPVESSNRFESIISETKIINNGWNKKHIKSIKLAYRKTKYFDNYFGDLEFILLREYKYLADLNYDILLFALSAMNINVPVVKASDYDFCGKKSDLVLDMCIQLGADSYIFGEQGKNYADESAFVKNGVSVYFQSYVHPKYNQFGNEFNPYMSFVDLLFNEGEYSRDIIMNKNIQSINV